MFTLIGFTIVCLSILGGFFALGGHITVLWQPFEFLIIGGSAIGAVIIATPKAHLGKLGTALKIVLKDKTYTKADYLNLLSLLYLLLRLSRNKGMVALEPHIEQPKESSIFQQFSGLLNNREVINFISDYLRIMAMGAENPQHIETIMEIELDTQERDAHQTTATLQQVADSLPALGIVAAVLGVIKTMGSITEPPEVLGKLIGSAMVGTFLGILLSYGLIGPIGQRLSAHQESRLKFLGCVKAAIIAHLQGCAPAISIEYARKTIQEDIRPSFEEVEETIRKLPG